MQEDCHSVGQVSETGKALTKWHKIIRARGDLGRFPLFFIEAKTSSNSFYCLSANGLAIPRIGRRVDGFRISSKSAFSSNTLVTLIDMLDVFDMDDMEDMGSWWTWWTVSSSKGGKVKITQVQNFYRVAWSPDLTELYILQRQQSNDIGCIRGVQGLILFYWLLGICSSGLERYFALQPCSKTPSWWHHKIPLSILSFSLCIIWIPSKSSWMHRRRHRKVFYRPGICSRGVYALLTQKFYSLAFMQ